MRVFTPEDFNLPIPQQFERPGNSRQTPQMVIPPMGVPSGGGLASSDYPAGGGIAGGIGGNAGGVDSFYGFQFPNNGSMNGKEYAWLNNFLTPSAKPKALGQPQPYPMDPGEGEDYGQLQNYGYGNPPPMQQPVPGPPRPVRRTSSVFGQEGDTGWFGGPSTDYGYGNLPLINGTYMPSQLPQQYSGTPSAPAKIGTNSYLEGDAAVWGGAQQPGIDQFLNYPYTQYADENGGNTANTFPGYSNNAQYDENGAVIPQTASQPNYGSYDTRIDPGYYSAGLSSLEKRADANGVINTSVAGYHPSLFQDPLGYLKGKANSITAEPDSFTLGNGIQALTRLLGPFSTPASAILGRAGVGNTSTGNSVLDLLATPSFGAGMPNTSKAGVMTNRDATAVDWSGGDPGVMAGLNKVYGQKSVYDPSGTGWQSAPLTLNPTNPGYQLYGANDWESQYADPSFGQAPAPAPSWSDLNGPAWGFNADASGYGGRYVNNPTYSAPQYNPSGNSLESPGWLEQMWGPISRFVSGDKNNTD